MRLNFRLMAVIPAALAASVGLAAHAPTAWTQGHYTGDETTAEDAMAYWSIDEPEQDGVVSAADGSGKGHILSERLEQTQYHAVGEGRIGKRLICTHTTNAMPALHAVSDSKSTSEASGQGDG